LTDKDNTANIVEKIRCCITGLGRIGSILEDDRLREKPCTHAGAIRRNRDCRLTAGCDINKERRELFAQRWNCSRVYEDVRDMLKTNQCDILHIATPPETHLEIIKTALPYEPKVIICEKPLAENSKDALKIAELDNAGKIKILTNHERRYSKDYQRAKKHIDGQTLGRLLSISSQLFMGKNRAVDDTLLHDGTHLIDIINFLTSAYLEKVETVKFSASERESLIIISKSGKIPVILEIGSGRDYLEFTIILNFSSGKIRIGNGLYEEYRSIKSSYYEKMNSLEKTSVSRPKTTGYFKNMLLDAVQCIKFETHEPLSGAWHGYKAIEFIDSIKRKQKVNKLY